MRLVILFFLFYFIFLFEKTKSKIIGQTIEHLSIVFRSFFDTQTASGGPIHRRKRHCLKGEKKINLTNTEWRRKKISIVNVFRFLFLATIFFFLNNQKRDGGGFRFLFFFSFLVPLPDSRWVPIFRLRLMLFPYPYTNGVCLFISIEKRCRLECEWK